MVKETDRRVKYTKMVLKDSLIELLNDKPISKITVKSICEKADINRSTFYTHYKDQFDLLQQLKDSLYASIDQYVSECGSCDQENSRKDLVHKIMLFIIDNKKMCSLMFGEKGDLAFQKRVLNIIEPPFSKGMNDMYGEEKAAYLYSYVVNGSLGLIQTWLKNDLRESPELIADLIANLTSNGLKHYAPGEIK